MTVTTHAFAKINLTLRVLGLRADGYHELRTTFQSIAIDDALTFETTSGPFEITCDDPACPASADNIVWKAAKQLWAAIGRAGEPRGLRVHIEKRIPMQGGLGGGSADAAATLRALAVLWRTRRDEQVLHEAAAALGADVPFFLQGGTALGANRGDVLFPLPDIARHWVVLAVPRLGVSTKDAYAWLDDARRAFGHHAPRSRLRAEGASASLAVARGENRRAEVGERRTRRESKLAADSARSAWVVGNDLQAPVVARYPEIGKLADALKRSGARHAAMTGSGSTVFGLFATKTSAEAAADWLVARTSDLRAAVVVTRTLSRAEHERRTRPTLARK